MVAEDGLKVLEAMYCTGGMYHSEYIRDKNVRKSRRPFIHGKPVSVLSLHRNNPPLGDPREIEQSVALQAWYGTVQDMSAIVRKIN